MNQGRLDCVLMWTYLRVRQIVCSARKGFYIRCEMSYIVSEMDDVDVFEASEPSQPSSKRRKLLYQETLACQANSVPPQKSKGHGGAKLEPDIPGDDAAFPGCCPEAASSKAIAEGRMCTHARACMCLFGRFRQVSPVQERITFQALTFFASSFCHFQNISAGSLCDSRRPLGRR